MSSTLCLFHMSGKNVLASLELKRRKLPMGEADSKSHGSGIIATSRKKRLRLTQKCFSSWFAACCRVGREDRNNRKKKDYWLP